MFLVPAFLGGLAALSVPVVIHMLQSPRARQIDFPSVRFLKMVQKKATRRTRLKNLILMLLRMLLIAFICLGMAKPWEESEATNALPDAPVSMVLVLDNSYSMGYRDKGRSRFDQARQAAIDLVDMLKPGDEVAVLLVNEKVEPYIREFTTDLDRVKKALREAELSVVGTNLDPALREALRLARQAGSAAANAQPTTKIDAETAQALEEAEQRRRKEIHVLTDLQASGWDAVLKSGFLKNAATDARVFITSFGRKGSPNAYLESATVQATGTGQATVTARVRASGAGSPGNIITLSLNGRNVAQETFAVRPGKPASVPMVARFGESGTFQCILSLQEDGLAIDDRYYFTVDVGERAEVLVVDGDPSTVPHLSETFYLRSALNPGGVYGTGGPSAIDARVTTPADLPAQSLDDLRCVILANVGPLGGDSLLKLEDYLRKGGSVWVFLGDNAVPENYNQWTFLPIHLAQPVGDASKEKSFGFGTQRGDHPLFKRGLDLRSARFFVAWGTARRTLAEGANVLLEFDNGQPALVEGSFGQGRVLLFTSTCDLAWNNFPLRRAFLPWVHQVVYYLSNQETTAEAYRLGEPVTFQALSSEYKEVIRVTDPSGRGTTLRPRVEGGYATAEFTATDLPGMYGVQAAPAFSHSGGFGVNLDVSESVLDMAREAEIAEAAPAGMVTFVEGPKRSVVEEVKKTREGKEWWPLLFKLALLVFVLESLFGNLISRAKRPEGARVPLFEVLRQRQPGIVQ
ncbi:MAG: BatA domain-containing protein [Planctomycetota bacterium]